MPSSSDVCMSSLYVARTSERSVTAQICIVVKDSFSLLRWPLYLTSWLRSFNYYRVGFTWHLAADTAPCHKIIRRLARGGSEVIDPPPLSTPKPSCWKQHHPHLQQQIQSSTISTSSWRKLHRTRLYCCLHLDLAKVQTFPIIAAWFVYYGVQNTCLRRLITLRFLFWGGNHALCRHRCMQEESVTLVSIRGKGWNGDSGYKGRNWRQTVTKLMKIIGSEFPRWGCRPNSINYRGRGGNLVVITITMAFLQ